MSIDDPKISQHKASVEDEWEDFREYADEPIRLEELKRLNLANHTQGYPHLDNGRLFSGYDDMARREQARL
jgi:hypothetical protein